MNEKKTPAETKKAYVPPVLSEYGDIRQITQATTGKKNDMSGSQQTN